jgi:D-ribose pyranase
VRSNGVVHAELARALTALRHTDLFAVSDSGLPVPREVPVLDLGIAYGLPGFLPVLDVVLAEVTVEAAWASADIATANSGTHTELDSRLAPELLDHEEFKRLIAGCSFVVRTGEATPYANVLLRAGVPWMAADRAPGGKLGTPP